MRIEEVNQSILVSGESGAGKTETTKIMMAHLASVAGGTDDETIRKVLECNPLLESFGNAKTVRNDNSSRFGKFTILQFGETGRLIGASCKTYLLERSRIVHQTEEERNYHIFHQVLAAPVEEKERYHLVGGAGDFRFVPNSTCTVIEGCSDADAFVKTKTALGLIGIDDDVQGQMFTLMGVVLNLGQVRPRQRGCSSDLAMGGRPAVK